MMPLNELVAGASVWYVNICSVDSYPCQAKVGCMSDQQAALILADGVLIVVDLANLYSTYAVACHAMAGKVSEKSQKMMSWSQMLWAEGDKEGR